MYIASRIRNDAEEAARRLLAKTANPFVPRDDDLEVLTQALAEFGQKQFNDAQENYRQRDEGYRKRSAEDVKRLGYEPGQLQFKWRTNAPPFADTAEWYNESVYAIIDALCCEGIPAWHGDATSCVQQIVRFFAEKVKESETT